VSHKNDLFLLILIFAIAGGILLPNYCESQPEIIAEDKEKQSEQLVTQALQTYEKKSPSRYALKKWHVKEEDSPIQKALNVYKKRDKPSYLKKLWVVDKNDGTNSFVLEYQYGGNDEIIFSPTEDFLYYIGLSAAGQDIIYGLNLSNRKQFVIQQGSDFDVISCANEEHYVVVHELGTNESHIIYQTDGKQVNSLNGAMNIDEIKKQVCF